LIVEDSDAADRHLPEADLSQPVAVHGVHHLDALLLAVTCAKEHVRVITLTGLDFQLTKNLSIHVNKIIT
jgi:hypothetical protein